MLGSKYKKLLLVSLVFLIIIIGIPCSVYSYNLYKQNAIVRRNQYIISELRNAKEQATNNKFDIALGTLENVLKIDPQNVDALNLKDDVLFLRDHPNLPKEIQTQDQAKEVAQSLYINLQLSKNLPSGYKFASILTDHYFENPVPGNSHLTLAVPDYSSGFVTFEKEVVPDVLSRFERIVVRYDKEGKLISYTTSSVPPKSTEIKITKEQAIEIANARMIKAFGVNGSDGLSVPDTNLQVVESNYYDSFPGLLDKKDKYVTLTWVVHYSYQGTIKGFSELYVDANTGEVIGREMIQ